MSDYISMFTQQGRSKSAFKCSISNINLVQKKKKWDKAINLYHNSNKYAFVIKASFIFVPAIKVIQKGDLKENVRDFEEGQV